MDIPAMKDYCVNSARNTGAVEYGKDLDYSDASVVAVSEILDDLHEKYKNGDENVTDKRAGTLARIFGIYVGEVLRCNHLTDYIWLERAGLGIILVKDIERFVDPVRVARGQITGDNEESIKAFFDAQAGGE